MIIELTLITLYIVVGLATFLSIREPYRYKNKLKPIFFAIIWPLFWVLLFIGYMAFTKK